MLLETTMREKTKKENIMDDNKEREANRLMDDNLSFLNEFFMCLTKIECTKNDCIYHSYLDLTCSRKYILILSDCKCHYYKPKDEEFIKYFENKQK